MTLKAIGKTTVEVIAIIGLSELTIQSILSRAIYRGFDPAIRPVLILNKLIEDVPRSGRTTKQAHEVQS
jgi:hypothetical protein